MKHLTVYSIVWLLYVTGISLFSLFIKQVEFVFIVWSVIGSLVGFALPILLDVVLPHLISGSATPTKEFMGTVVQQSMTSVKQGNVYSASVPPTPLRSYPLLLGYAITALFVITSTQNYLGRGFVLGLGLSLVLDLWISKNPSSYLRQRWFSVFKTNLNDQELSFFVFGVVVIFSLFTIIALFM